MSLNKFMAEYARQLEQAITECPDDYAWASETPIEVVLDRFRTAVAAGSMNKDGIALRRTCRSLSIRHTYKAIAEFVKQPEDEKRECALCGAPEMPWHEIQKCSAGQDIAFCPGCGIWTTRKVTKPVGQDGAQKPDDRPGAYYVSCVDGPRHSLLAGPYINDHAAALAAVDSVRKIAVELDLKAYFYGFGTCRVVGSQPKPGMLNRLGKL